MKQTIILAFVVTALILAYAGSEGNIFALQQNKVEQELMQLERDWCAAQVNKDAATLGRILADDYTAVSSRGSTSTKADELANLKSADSMTTCMNNNIKVRVYGDAAVVTGLSVISGIYKGVPFKDRQVFWTDIFIKKDGRWECVAGQSTLVAAQQK